MEFFHYIPSGAWMYFGSSAGIHTNVYKGFSLGIAFNYMYGPPARDNINILYSRRRYSLDAEVQYNFKELGNGFFIGTVFTANEEFWNNVADKIESNEGPIFVLRIYGGKNFYLTKHFSLGVRLGAGPEVGDNSYSIQTSVYGLYRF